MPKTLIIFLTTTPYAFENTHTALRLAEAALDKGYAVNIFASADGVHNFTVGHKTSGVPNAEEGFNRLRQRDLYVELCGSCLVSRGLRREQHLEGTEPSSIDRLFKMMQASHAFITLGF